MIKVSDGSVWKSSKLLLLPIMLLSQAFGLTFSYGYGRQCTRVIHRIAVSGILVSIFLHEVPSILFWLRASKGLHRTLVKFETSSRWFLFFLNYVLTTLFSTRVKAIIDDLQNCDLKLSDNVLLRIFRYHIGHIILNVSLIVLYDILGHDFMWNNSNHDSVTSIAYIFNDMMIVWSGFEFVHMANVVREFFRYINATLEGLTSQTGSSETEIVKKTVIKLRNMHLYLCNTCKKINTCFSIQILCIILFAVIQMTYALRAFISEIIRTDIKDRVEEACFDILWASLYMFWVYQIIAVADYTAFESKKSSIIVHHLINDHFASVVLEKELELFSLQIHQHQAVFSIWLFDLKFALLNTVIGLLTTYMIILLTFHEEWNHGYLSGWDFDSEE